MTAALALAWLRTSLFFRTLPLPAMSTSTSAPLPAAAASNALLTSVVSAMHRLAPLSLADTAWDNVGLLVESPSHPSASGVMLGIDLTTSVCDEILSSPHRIGVAVIYHPIIFRGLKCLTYSHPQQTSILRLLQHGVSVYCPHTSLDATVGGINDWLAVVVSHHTMPDLSDASNAATTLQGEGKWQPITPAKEEDAQGQQGAGMGRIVKLQNETSFEEMVERVKRNLGLDHVQGCKASDRPISTIGVCAGSGSSVFRGVQADLLLTGELSHHEVLAYKAAGTSVILTNHTNTERKYLSDVLQHRLAELLQPDTKVLVSQADRDPLQTF
ncbi:hypothetical protein ACQY0O_001193 [Thecaphora frezii]